MRTAFGAGDPEAIGWFVREALERSEYPAWYPGQYRRYRIACHPDRAAITVELEFPPPPTSPRPPLRVRRASGRAPGRAPLSDDIGAHTLGYWSVALRTASEALAATAERADTVRTVTVNGRATGAGSRDGPALPPAPHQCFCNKRSTSRPFPDPRATAIVPGHPGCAHVSRSAGEGSSRANSRLPRISRSQVRNRHSAAAAKTACDQRTLLTIINVDRPFRPI